MPTYALEQWYKAPEGEKIILNQNYFCGTYRFVKRTRDLKGSYQQVAPLLLTLPPDGFSCWNVGSGYHWERPGKESYFLALSLEDEQVAWQFELSYC